MEANSLRPLKRGRLRLAAGKAFYSLTRYLFWHSGTCRFAKTRRQNLLPYLQFSHHTPLLRELKDVDMQYQYNKIINLKLAVKNLDGIVVRPGETFSYWKLIGKPTAKKGYVPGMVLFCGSFHMSMGGGLCQLSNLIYWMTLHTPLTVVERYRHSYDVFPDSNRTQPFGSGATCFYPYRDLMIRNDTDTEFQLSLKVETEDLAGGWYAGNPPRYRYEVIEKDHLFKAEYWGGFSRHNKLYRKRYTLDGKLADEEYITENHAIMMYSPFLPSGE
ncbi:MAG TPA: VanW family protein [Bacillota bacterium]|nr:VanW family protein [Bacillota bacterium]